MAQSNVNMSKLKRSFQMLAAKIPQRTICEQLHMGRGVLNRYKTLRGFPRFVLWCDRPHE